MNIVHVEDFLHPNAGYQVNILSKYMVEQGHLVTIITSKMEKIPDYLTNFFGRDEIEKNDREYEKKTGVNIIRLPLSNYISGRAVFTSRLFETVDFLKPDVLFVHGNDTLTGIRYIMRLKKINYPIVMDSHMLEMASINKFNKLYRILYRKIITPIIVKNKIPVIRTQNDSYVENFLGIPLDQCPWISVGSDTLLFHPDKITRENFRRSNDIGNDDFVIVYTGKLDEAKGGMLLAQAFKNKFKTEKQVVLVVVGNATGEYGKAVEDIFSKSENAIIRFPTQKYTELAKFYQAADLSVFPKQCSLSFYDAQACGLPVLSENNNINIDRLKFGNGACFIAEDINDFRKKIIEFVEMEGEDYKKISENAYNFVKTNYNYKEIAQKYTDILREEFKKFNNKMR